MVKFLKNILEGSLIFRFLTVAANWVDRQWARSYLGLLFSGAEVREQGGDSLIGRAGSLLRRLWSRLLLALKMDRLLQGSMFSHPFFWCALAAASAPVLPTVVVAGIALVGVISMFLRLGCDPGFKVPYSPVNKWITLYALVYLAASLTSVTVKESLPGGLLTSFLVLFAVAMQGAVTERRQVDLLIHMMVAAGAITALYGFYQIFAGVEGNSVWLDKSFRSVIGLRVYSFLGNPNVLAEYLLLAIPLGAAVTVTAETSFGRGSAAIATGMMVLCMVLTYSRGGYLGLVASVAVFLVLMDRRFIVLGALALLALPFVLPQSVLARFVSITDLSDSSTSYRIYIWMATLNMLKDYWFSGIGTGFSAFAAVYPAYSFNAVSAPHSHNLFLQVTCECGILGIFALLAVIFSFLRLTGSALGRGVDKKTKIQLTAVIAAVMGFLLMGLTDYSFYNYRVMVAFWVVIGVGALLSRRWEAAK